MSEFFIPSSGELPPLPTPMHPRAPVALEPDDFPHPLRAHDVMALLPKDIA